MAPNTVAAAKSTVSSSRIKTVWLIVMENANWSSIRGNTSAPYINHTLLPMASSATQYYNPPHLHPSLPNYIWLEAGTNFGITDDNSPSDHRLSTRQHLVTLLSHAGISWRAYEENISGTTCPLKDRYPYAVRHDPFVYFDDVTNHGSPTSRTCISHIRPFSELATDLQHNREARYNFITPNVCDDMHDACSPLNNPIEQGDRWLARTIPTILHSQAYKQGGAILITWDEANTGDGPIGMIVLSPFAKGHGYTNTVHYTHSSTLRTLEEVFGVRPFLGDAAHAGDLRDLFVRGAVEP